MQTLNAQTQVTNGTSYLMNEGLDLSADFTDLANTYFLANELKSFDASKGEGLVNWKRFELQPRQAFNTNLKNPIPLNMLDFPTPAYVNDPDLKFKVDFVTPRTIRIRMLSTPVEPKPNKDELMLVGEPPIDHSWKLQETTEKVVYSSEYGTLEIIRNPWRLVLKDKMGKVLT